MGNKIHNYKGFISFQNVRTGILDHLDIKIPLEALTVVTGESGSGKTVLAMETIYAESLRRQKVKSGLFFEHKGMPPYCLESLFYKADRLIPVVNVLDMVVDNLSDASLLEVLHMEAALKSMFSLLAIPKCELDDCKLHIASPEVVSRKIKTDIGESLPNGENLFLLCACLRLENLKQGDLSKRIAEIIFDAMSSGYYRFIVCGYYLKLSDEIQLETQISSLISGLKKQKVSVDIAIVLNTQSGLSDIEDAISQSFKEAKLFGFDVVLIQEFLNYSDIGDENYLKVEGRKWFSSSAYYCSKCNRVCDFVKSRQKEIVESEDKPIVWSMSGFSYDQLLELSILELAVIIKKQDISGEHLDKLTWLSSFLLKRFNLLIQFGFGQLKFNSKTAELSIGERIKIAIVYCCSDNLSNTLIVADEPSRFLHPYDMNIFLNGCRRCVELGNTVLLVEQSEVAISASDYIIHLALNSEGKGRISYQGESSSYSAESSLPSSTLLSTEKKRLRSSRILKYLEIPNVNFELSNNILRLPLGSIVSVCGISGSGKSYFLSCIHKSISGCPIRGGRDYNRVEGSHYIDAVELLNASWMLTNRSVSSHRVWNFCGLLNCIAQLFASTRESRILGLGCESFLLDSDSSKCEVCHGAGYVVHFAFGLGSSVFTCDSCCASGYASQLLDVYYLGLNIADMLKLSLSEALKFFEKDVYLSSVVKSLCSFGLGNLRLGTYAHACSSNVYSILEFVNLITMKKTQDALLLFDQTFSNLSLSQLIICISKLKELKLKNTTSIIVTHDPQLIAMSDYVLEFSKEKKINFFGKSFDFPLDQFKNLSNVFSPSHEI